MKFRLEISWKLKILRFRKFRGFSIFRWFSPDFHVFSPNDAYWLAKRPKGVNFGAISIYIYIWLGPNRSSKMCQNALKSSWSDLQAAKESGRILGWFTPTFKGWGGPKTSFFGHLYTHEFDYVGQPDSMKVRLRGAKIVEPKISSNFDSKFYLKIIFRDFEIFADLRVI